MKQLAWLSVAALVIVAGCSSDTDGRKAGATPSEQIEPLSRTKGEGHLRVLVRYEAGTFQVERSTWIAGPLKQPRSKQPRAGLQYLAKLSDKPTFWGSAPDPREVHVETPGPTGQMEHQGSAPPGKQYFTIYVPDDTQTVDFHDSIVAQSAPSNTSQQATGGINVASRALGSIDLRNQK
jgi:hypothetical protein